MYKIGESYHHRESPQFCVTVLEILGTILVIKTWEGLTIRVPQELLDIYYLPVKENGMKRHPLTSIFK